MFAARRQPLVRFAVAMLALVVLLASRVWSIDYLILSPGHGGGGGPCTTTTTTLPGCSNPGNFDCGTCAGAHGACIPHNPDNLCTCADVGSGGEACDLFANCTYDGGCAPGFYCFDARSLGGPNGICCPLCASGSAATPCPPTTTTTTLPCSSPVYCRCANDDFKPSVCTDDTDCAPGLFCQLIDASPTNRHCYRKTCTGPNGCDQASAEGSCNAVCAAHGGLFATFCQDGTCSGGSRDGQECFSQYSDIECPDGACNPGAPICSCAMDCRVTTTTTSTTTTTTAP